MFIHIICSRYGAGLGRVETPCTMCSAFRARLCVCVCNSFRQRHHTSLGRRTANGSACFRSALVVVRTYVPVVDPANSSPATGVHVGNDYHTRGVIICTVRVSSTVRLSTGRGHFNNTPTTVGRDHVTVRLRAALFKADSDEDGYLRFSRKSLRVKRVLTRFERTCQRPFGKIARERLDEEEGPVLPTHASTIVPGKQLNGPFKRVYAPSLGRSV